MSAHSACAFVWLHTITVSQRVHIHTTNPIEIMREETEISSYRPQSQSLHMKYSQQRKIDDKNEEETTAKPKRY